MATDTIRAWMESHGAKIHAGVVAQPMPEFGGGMGVVATRTIGAGVAVAQIPDRLTLTPRKARQACQLHPSVPTVPAVVAFLVRTRLGDPVTSFWAPWVSKLPARYDNFLELEDAITAQSSDPDAAAPSDTPPFSTVLASLLPLERFRTHVSSEIARWHSMRSLLASAVAPTSATTVLPSVVDGFYAEDEQEAMRAAIPAAVATGTDISTGQPSSAWSLVRWGYNSLMSRGFANDDETWAMIPWVDYFNYDADPNVQVRPNPRGGYSFVTSRVIQEGEQLCLRYGCYNDAEMGLWYGFALCRHGLSAPLSPGTAAQHSPYCSYAFSPLQGPDGDYDAVALASWLPRLAEASGLRFPKRFTTSPPEDCRVMRSGVSPGMGELVRGVAAASERPPADVLRAFVDAELRSTAPTASPAAMDESLPCVTFARHAMADAVDILRGLSGASQESLEALLS